MKCALLAALLAGAFPSAKPLNAVEITASSVYDTGYPAQAAIDANPTTRWASAPTMPQWLQVDFGKTVAAGTVVIRWETAHATHYQIQVSHDAKTWQTVYEKRDSNGGNETISHINAQGRYWRLLCLKAGAFGIASIWELEFPDTNLRQIIQAQHEKKATLAAEAFRNTAAQLGIQHLVFAGRGLGDDGHWYANFGYYARQPERKAYAKTGGRLYRLNLNTRKATLLVDDPTGGVRDPVVHYSGNKILFSWRKGGTDPYNLYEINLDGTGLRQITSGPWDDIEPTYLPDGGIVFVSSRCNRWVNCWLTQVAVLYRCDHNGKNIRPISSNNEQDNTPWVLPDGRILYTRWEYVDRSQVDYHHLWTTNPDGTNQTVYYGNMHPGTVIIDAKPIPQTRKILATFSPGHGTREHEGPFYVIDPRGGPDDRAQTSRAGNREGRDPFPIGQEFVLYAHGRTVRAMDYQGNDFELFNDPNLDLHEPRPVLRQMPEPVIPRRSDPAKTTGRLLLADAHIGRAMTGIKPGDIKKLLVLETLPKPINFTGGMDPLTWGGSFTLERIVGTVPVEPDGSAYLELPALRSFFFVALDKNDLAVKRMQSFLTVQPGEITGCVGCHEQRNAVVPTGRKLSALQRPPSTIQPLPDLPDVIDFPRDIQPILNRHCLSCHDYTTHNTATHGPRAGNVILSGDRGPMFSHSYAVLTMRQEFADGRNQPKSNRPPRSIGASASPIMTRLAGQHYDATLSNQELNLIKYWIETGATYPGTYAALGTGMIGGYYENSQVETDNKWPQSAAARDSIDRRCASCHHAQHSLPRNLSDENGLSFWQPDWADPRIRRSRHLVFNLTRPELSMILLAPLAKEAGGFGLCAKNGQPVFATTNDPDYRIILDMCAAGKNRLEQIKRFDMPGFVPDPAYLREMKKYGLDTNAPNPYQMDRNYWKSLWCQPQPPEH